MVKGQHLWTWNAAVAVHDPCVSADAFLIPEAVRYFVLKGIWAQENRCPCMLHRITECKVLPLLQEQLPRKSTHIQLRSPHTAAALNESKGHRPSQCTMLPCRHCHERRTRITSRKRRQLPASEDPPAKRSGRSAYEITMLVVLVVRGSLKRSTVESGML